MILARIPPIISGTQAPWGTFRTADPQKRPSTNPKSAKKARAKTRGRRLTTYICTLRSRVVERLTVETAKLDEGDELGS